MKLPEPLRGGRVLTAAGLAVVAVVLFLINSSLPLAPEERAQEVRMDVRSVSAVVDTLLARHGIARDRVRSWPVRIPGGTFVRLERRVLVPPGFVSVKFNQELNEELEGTGARVVATERTKENTVTAHIKSGSTIIETISFVVERPTVRKGKERPH